MRVCALAVVAVLGCAHRPPPRAIDPDAALGAWSRAIARGDAHAAYGLLCSSLRERQSEADFALQWKAAQPDLSAQKHALAAGYSVRRAAGELADGRAWPLARNGADWRLDAVRPLEPGGDTPEDALRRLVAAVETRDFDAVLALLADPLRSTLQEALTERLARLKSAVKRGGIEATGNSARIRYDPRYHLDLVQENGRWRIADFN